MPQTDTNVSNLIINILDSAKYSELQEGGQLSETQLYMITDDNLNPSSSLPIMDGTAATGSSLDYARGDHIHPTDTSRAPIASPSFTGTPTAPTAAAGTSSTQIATTEFVQNAVGSAGGGTVTSVRVQATSPVQSSQSTAQTATLNTTISLANGYGDTKNPYGTKTAGTVLAGPSSGSAAVPSFRSLVASDIPNLTVSKITDFPDIPSKTSDLTNDSGFITAAQAPVQSVNGQTGTVTITETDPIFSASVAAGITDTNIDNWNKLKNSPQIGYSVSSGIRVSNNVTFHTSGDSDYSDGFVLFHNTTMTNGYFYRLDGSSTGGYQFTNILLDGVGCSFSAVPIDSIYLARMYDNGLWLTSIASKATVTDAINALDGGDIGTGSTTKTITNLSQTNGNVSATFSDIAFPVTSVNTQTGAVVLDADDIDYDNNYSVKEKIDTIIASGGEPNVIETVKVNGTALTVTNKAVDVPVPTTVLDNTTGISIANHSTSSIYGVSSSTTSVTGVQSTTTTASKVTLGTAISVPNVTSAGSASNWVFENITVPIKDSSSKTIPNVTAVGSGSFTQGSFSGGSFTQGTDSFTPNTPTTINTTKFNGGSFTQGTDSFTAATHGSDSFTAAKLNTGFYTAGTAASFTRGSFSGGSFTQGTDSFTANTPTAINISKFNGGSFTRGSFSGGSFTRGAFSGGSLTITNDTTSDANHHILTFAFSPATHANDTFTAATHANDSFTPASLASGFYTAGTAASFTQGEDTFTAATHANDSFTANTPTVIDVTKFSGGSFTQGSFSGGSFTQGTDSHTAASLGTGFYTAGTAASFTQGEDEFIPATHGADSHTHVAPTLGTAFTITGVQSTTTTASHVKSGGNGTAPTLGTAISIPNVTSVSDVTVPIKATSATTVPIKNGTATTVVTSANHNITDEGHSHGLSYQIPPM